MSLIRSDKFCFVTNKFYFFLQKKKNVLTESDVPVWLIYMNTWGNSWYLYFSATLLYTTLHLRDKYTVLLH